MEGWLVRDGGADDEQEGRTDDDGVVPESIMGSLHGRDGARHGTGTACGSHWVWTVLTWGGCLGRMMDVGKRGGRDRGWEIGWCGVPRSGADSGSGC